MSERGDFGGLRGVLDEAKDLQRELGEAPLADCPHCGTPLQRNERRALLGCPMGHFQAPIGARKSEYA